MPLSLTAIQLKRLTIAIHRWMGVCFCLLFTWWFLSGIFMMYWGFPSIRSGERLDRAALLDPSQVRLSLREALESAELSGPADSVRLAMFDGRPAFFIRAFGIETIVYADNGQRQLEFPPHLTRRIASQWTGQPDAEALEEYLEQVDQWTIQGIFRNRRPIVKYSWPDGEQVYVSAASGEVVQYTTQSSRIFAHLGAIPHWLYYTPLRKNTRLWSKIVIALSGLATLTALLGLFLGIWMYSPRTQYSTGRNETTSIPYTGQKRLHLVFGLFFGLTACTWAFSGMLSMDPFPTKTGEPTGATIGSAHIAEVLQGGRIFPSAFAAKAPSEALRQAAVLPRVKELQLVSLAGEPAYLALQDAQHSLVVPIDGPPRPEFDHEWLAGIMALASKPNELIELHVLSKYDSYYLDRRYQKPLPVLLARLNDQEHTRYYIDPRTARVVGFYTSSQWANRWLYHGLHSINLPWLYDHRPAWDVVVLILMLGGVSLSATSVTMSVVLLKRKRKRLLEAPSDRKINVVARGELGFPGTSS